jgi:hypothetical protein
MRGERVAGGDHQGEPVVADHTGAQVGGDVRRFDKPEVDRARTDGVNDAVAVRGTRGTSRKPIAPLSPV